MARIYIQKDLTRASTYAASQLRGSDIIEFQAPLYDVRGISPAPSSLKDVQMLARIFPRADILARKSGVWILVECKSNAQLRELAQLDFYEDALRHDVIRRPGSSDQVRRIFVTDREDARLREACTRQRIEFVVLGL